MRDLTSSGTAVRKVTLLVSNVRYGATATATGWPEKK